MKKEFVWLVGNSGPEHNHIESIHKTEEGALKGFQKHRKKLLKNADADEICNLKETNPKEIDNYPHETPYIQKMEIVT